VKTIKREERGRIPNFGENGECLFWERKKKDCIG